MAGHGLCNVKNLNRVLNTHTVAGSGPNHKSEKERCDENSSLLG